jgi:hypothetical protein
MGRRANFEPATTPRRPLQQRRLTCLSLPFQWHPVQYGGFFFESLRARFYFNLRVEHGREKLSFRSSSRHPCHLHPFVPGRRPFFLRHSTSAPSHLVPTSHAPLTLCSPTLRGHSRSGFSLHLSARRYAPDPVFSTFCPSVHSIRSSLCRPQAPLSRLPFRRRPPKNSTRR